MALIIDQSHRLNAVRIISRNDDAVDEEASDWEVYDKDPVRNEKALVMKADQTPTIFLCNFELTGKEAANVKDALISGIDDEKNIKMSYGKWSYRVTQLTLKGIENPPNVKDVIEYKKDGRGYVSDQTMTLLERMGLVSEIFTHYTSLTQSKEKENAKNL